MARQFNGTSDTAKSSAVLDLTGSQKAAFSFWLWVDSYVGTNHSAMQLYNDGGSGIRTRLYPDSGLSQWYVEYVDSAPATAQFARPSAAAWHQFVFNFDISKASGEIDTIYVDGVSQSLDRSLGDGNNSGGFATNDRSLYVGCAAGPAEFLAGRVAELGVYSGVNLDPDEAVALGKGFSPLLVRPTALYGYWPLLGRYSPEINLRTGNDLTLTGTSNADHPRIIYPAPPLIEKWASAAAGGPTTAQMAGTLAQQRRAQSLGAIYV